MSEKQDHSALNWVKKELDETLKRAANALEEYVEGDGDAITIQQCATCLHQAYGTLQMVEVYGAAMLAEEMELAARGLVDNTIIQKDEANQVLARSIISLQDYLERIQQGAQDIPIVLLPQLNDLRATRGAALLSEGGMFAPDLSAFTQAPSTTEKPAPELRGMAKRFRQAFQISLLGWLRGRNQKKNLDQMAKVIEQMHKHSRLHPVVQLWWIAGGVLVCIREGALGTSPTMKKLLGQVDREIKRYIDAGEEDLANNPDLSLVKNLLYYIASSKCKDPYILSVRKVYGLTKAIPSEAEIQEARDNLSAPSMDLMHTVLEAIREDLIGVKDTLDLFTRGSGQVQDLEPMIDSLHRVGDTLGMLSRGDLRKRIQQQIERTRKLVAAGTKPSEDDLLAVAEELLFVESSLGTRRRPAEQEAEAVEETTDQQSIAQSLIPEEEFRIIEDVTMLEATEDLSNAKAAIIAYINVPNNMEPLGSVPAYLQNVEGALQMLSMERAGAVLHSLMNFVKEKLLTGERETDPQKLDLLADTLTGVECFIEAVREHLPNRDNVLDIIAKSVGGLGYPLPGEENIAFDSVLTSTSENLSDNLSLQPSSEQETPPPERVEKVKVSPADLEPETEPEADTTTKVEPEKEVDIVVAVEGEGSPEKSPSAQVAMETTPAEENASESVITETFEPTTEIPSVEAAPVATISKENWLAPPIPTSVEGITIPPDELDDDILDIFTEEAREVLETIEDCYPKWQANPQDKELCTTLRRSFHTLKGSGRMVGAFTVGELAWPIENLFSSISEKTIQPSPSMFALLDEYRRVIPSLVDSLENNTPVQYDVARLGGWAKTLSEGKEVEVLPAPPSIEFAPEPAMAETVKTGEVVVEASKEEAPIESSEAVDIALPPIATKGDANGPPISTNIKGPTIPPDELDEEILDIFAEEATEVIEAIEENLPIWRANLQDKESQATLRRSFHTLKGSGRMAGAFTVGELAWPVENLFNLIAEKTIQPSPSMFALIEECIRVIPGLVTCLENNTPVEYDVSRLAGWAEALGRGEEVEVLRTPPTTSKPIQEASPTAKISDSEETYKAHKEKIPFEDDTVPVAEDEGFFRIPSEAEIKTSSKDAFVATKASAFEEPSGNEGWFTKPVEVTSTTSEKTAESEKKETRLQEESLDAAEVGESQAKIIQETPSLAESNLQDFELTETSEDQAEVVQEAPPLAESSLQDFKPTEAGEDQAEVAQKAPPLAEPSLQGFGVTEVGENQAEVAQKEGSSEKPNPQEANDNRPAKATVESGGLAEIIEESPEVVETELVVAEEKSLEANQDAELESLTPVVKSGEAELVIVEVAQKIESAALDEVGETKPVVVDTAPQFSPDVDQALLEIFEKESRTHLDVLREFISHCNDSRGPCRINDALIRSVHTLHGSAHMAGSKQIAALSGKLESVLRDLEENGQVIGKDLLEVLVESVGAIDNLLVAMKQQGEALDYSALLQRIITIGEQIHLDKKEGIVAIENLAEDDETTDIDEDMAEIFLEEGRDLLESMDDTLQVWQENPENIAHLAELQRMLHTLKGGARLVGVKSMGNLAHAIESLLTLISSGEIAVQSAHLDISVRTNDRLSVMLDELATKSPLSSIEDLLQKISHLCQQEAGAEMEEAPVEPTLVAKLPEVTAPEEIVEKEDEYDEDLLDIFLEEAQDLLEKMEGTVQNWIDSPEEISLIADMQRSLHTLKGGARLVGVTKMGDLTHTIETLLTPIVQKTFPANEKHLEITQRTIDHLSAMLAKVTQREPVAAARNLIAEIEILAGGGTAPTKAEEVAAPSEPTKSTPKKQKKSETKKETRAPQDLIRVRADLLDNLVGYAGEVNIYRARMEEEAASFRFNITELGQTVGRLREQLRKMDIETEAQILSRYAKETDTEDFDPLEMDRFSLMQQLSRALLESVTDLSNIEGFLSDLHHDSETLLLQQSRLINDLQEGLLRTRMVPFANMVPRMRRLVRQTSQQLGKKVDLDVLGAEGEMDRSILDRIMGPLEHLLRNALSHGIENIEERKRANKPINGRVTLLFAREGGDVLVKVSDDGRGIDTGAVRAKAVKQGMVKANAKLSEDEIMQFILEPGFSTAQQVTQISGRGVGMDVVTSEIKQMGGSLQITSKFGQGSNFIVRLPLTLAINQAILVLVGEDTYAVPLSTVEGVVRISRQDLEKAYATADGNLEHAGEIHQVRHLGTVLGVGDGHFEAQTKWASVLLVRSSTTGGQRIAFQVEGLAGNREIVIKPVGPQLSSVRWISGATILADGRVVLILDVAAIARMRPLQEAIAEAELEIEAAEKQRQISIMVVDDSITVRKVSGRLLERNGMLVQTAKDGVDALTVLEEYIPDIMLLDIEMPRMDGYELAQHIRNNDRLKHIPIIMITSRTGDKHRERAKTIGVNDYLGKPFREEELLEHIHALLGESV